MYNCYNKKEPPHRGDIALFFFFLLMKGNPLVDQDYIKVKDISRSSNMSVKS